MTVKDNPYSNLITAGSSGSGVYEVTSLNVTGRTTTESLRVTDTAVSTSTITGAAVISGGLGVAGAAYIGGTLNAAGAATFTTIGASGVTSISNTTEWSGTSGALTVAGGVYIAKKLNVVGDFSVATNKFNVAASSGNTSVAGTLSVTGLATFTNKIVTSAGLAATPAIYPTGDANTGIWFPAADTVAISTGGSERVRVDASANVGISKIPETINTYYASLQMGGNSNIMAYKSEDANSPIMICNNMFYNTSYQYIPISTGNACFILLQQGAIKFYANGSLTQDIAYTPTERARIDISGNMGIAMTPSGSHKLDVTGSAGLSTGTTWTNTCDARLKENIEDADLDICYNNVKNLPLKYYKLRDNYFDAEIHKDRHKVGWVADDVEKIFQKSVGVQKFIGTVPVGEKEISVENEKGEIETKIEKIYDTIEDCKNLNIDSIISAMYGAIQKLQIKVEKLEAV